MGTAPLSKQLNALNYQPAAMDSSKAPLLRFLEATGQTVPTAYLAFTLFLGALGFAALYAFPLAALLLLIDVIDTVTAGGESIPWQRQ